MSRRGAFAILGASAGVVVATAFFVVVAIAAGAWQPRGPVPAAPSGPPTWETVLDDVRAGRVQHVTQVGAELTVYENGRAYGISLPDESIDVQAELEAAAAETGVNAPSFDRGGDPAEPAVQTVAYDDFLEKVRAGEVYEVSHEGANLHASGTFGEYEVMLSDSEAPVLADIEAAANAGGVRPPVYSKVPQP